MAGTKKALVIAISDYHDENLEDLDFCRNDGREMSNTLKNIGYEITEDCYLVGEISYEKMKKSMIKFFQDDNVNPKDTLLIYFSGHGVLDGYGGRFFATSQIDTKTPEEYGVSFDFLTAQMKKSNSEKKVAILDCCFSGDAFSSTTGKSAGGAKGEQQAEELGREALSRHFEGSQGNCVLASSLSNRRSFQLPDKPFSAFTYYAIEGLKKNKDSIDGDCCVTPETLSQYIFSKLRQIKGLNQKPVRNISVAGKIILAEYPELKTTLQKKAALEKTAEVKKLKTKQQKQVAIIIAAAVLITLGISVVALSSTIDNSPKDYPPPTPWGDKGFAYDKNPNQVFKDSDGNTYRFVKDSEGNLDTGSISKFSPEGKLLLSFSPVFHPNSESYISSFSLDSSKNLYVVDMLNDKIHKFSSDGDVTEEWGGTGIIEGKFDGPDGIGIDSENNVYVSDTGNHRIQKFSENGVPIKSWTLEKGDFIKSGPGEKGGFADLPDDPSLTPHSIIIDPLDYVNVQVWDRNEQEYRINKYDSNGSLFKILGKGNDPIFSAPSEIVIDSKDNVYVINLNNEIQKFTPTDRTLKDPTLTDRTLPAPCPFNTIRISFGICFVQNWNLSVLKTGSVEGIAVDKADNVFVSGTKGIQKFTSDGQPLEWQISGVEIGMFGDIAIDGFDDVYVFDLSDAQVVKLDKNGQFIKKLGADGTPSQFGKGSGSAGIDIDIDKSNNVFVLDYPNNRVQIFTNDGGYLTQFSVGEPSANDAINSVDITVDKSDNVFVVDSEKRLIKKFNNNGKYLTELGFEDSGEHRFGYPYALDIDSSGKVYITDRKSNLIKVFNPPE